MRPDSASPLEDTPRVTVTLAHCHHHLHRSCPPCPLPLLLQHAGLRVCCWEQGVWASQSCLTALKCKQTFGTLAFCFCCSFCKRDGQGMGCRGKSLCLAPWDGEGWDGKLVLVLACTTPSCSPGCFHTDSIFLLLFNCPPVGMWSRLVPCIPADALRMHPFPCLGPMLCPRVVLESAGWPWTSISADKIASIPSLPCQVSLQQEPSRLKPHAWCWGLQLDAGGGGMWAPRALMLSWGSLCLWSCSALLSVHAANEPYTRARERTLPPSFVNHHCQPELWARTKPASRLP